MYDELPDDIRIAHPFHMYDEIRLQPEAVARALDVAHSEGADVLRLIARSDRVFLTGCGTSLHAARGGAHFLRWFSQGKVHARAVQAYEFATYEPGLSPGDLLIAVTQSGSTVMTMRAVERAHRSGMETVVVTGFPERVPVKGGQVLPTGYEDERSWAHTASYTAALTTFAAIANGLAEQSERLDLSPLPEVLREALELEGMAHSVAASAVVAERARGAPDVVLVGGGPNAVTASEGALKLVETSYTRAGSWELEEMLHGPLAAVDEGTLLLVIAPSGRSVERAAGLVRAARAIGAAPVAVVDEGNAGAFEDAHRLVMPEIPEVLSPIAYIVPVQLISYFLAVGKGINPDLIRRDDERYRRARSQYE